ncbi:MAG: methionyl-tRNA formyltransferase [Caldilineae bacterium]|nr:MAG: methionyl-tRNA formyltransferase [Caldilineae bacterium]
MTERIIFMGTPDFAVPSLQRLHGMYHVVAVVTQPDRPRGRGRKPEASPVKRAAEEAGLPVFQPPTLKDPQAVAFLRDLRPDVIVVAAFGQILRPDVLNLPPHGCINVHASLLPRWRGAAPVAAAIRAGDAETGVTLMLMDEGLDTGPILRARAIPIAPHHTRQSLTEDLARLGADLLADTLPDWLAGNITPRPQDDARATLAPRIKKEEGRIRWTQSAAEIERHVRAFYPWPGTFTHWAGRLLKIHSVAVAACDGELRPPGCVFRLGDDIAVAAGAGCVLLRAVQPAGKRPMPAADFARGAAGFIGAQLE